MGIENSRRNHMMTHPVSNQDDAAGEESGEEEPDAEEDEEAEDEESVEEAEDDDEEDGGQTVSPEVVAALKELSAKTHSSPIAGNRSTTDSGRSLASILLQAKVPESSWPEVCNLLTQLSVMGLVRVGAEKSPAATKRSTKAKGKRRTT